MTRIKLASLRTFALCLLAYSVARGAWDWKKLSHSQHPAIDFFGIMFQGIVATVCSFVYSRGMPRKPS